MKKVIVHSDINHCYAQIEEMLNPALKKVPMAVGGSVEKRHGIILAKNDRAKACKVRTGETLAEARAKCPGLLIVQPQYDLYVYYTEKIKDIYRKYTDRVESYGLDEAWIDLSGSQRLFGDGIALAKKIQDEVLETYGITVSMGVSFNKVFAKLGSDLFKHKGFAVIDESNYQDIVWNLEVGDLIMVGRHTEYKLEKMGIYTIGQLAKTPAHILQKRFGKMGLLLWRMANGQDTGEVSPEGFQPEVKSVGNSKTLVHDVVSQDQLQEVFNVLAGSTAARLRAINKRGYVLSVWLRDTSLRGTCRQKRMNQPTDLAKEISAQSMSLALTMLPSDFALRSIGIAVSDLYENSGYVQPGLFEAGDEKIKQRALEDVMEKIHQKYGFHSCRLAGSRLDEELTDFDPLSTLHQIHPIAFLNGPIG